MPQPPPPGPQSVAPAQVPDTIPSLGAGLDFTDPQSPLAPSYLRNGHVALVALLGLFVMLISYLPLWHTDVWGHLAFGRWMVEHRQLANDPLSPFAEPSPPGLRAYWLSQTGMYLTYHIGELLVDGDAVRRTEGGVQALRALDTLLVGTRFVVLLLALWRVSKSWPVAVTGLLFVPLLANGFLLTFRPQMFAELFFACLLLALSRDVLSRRAVVALPLLVALWANSHGSYPLGLALIGVWLVGRLLSVLGSAGIGGLFADVPLRRLLLALILSTAAVALLNPQGPLIFRDTLLIAQNPNVHRMDEWQPLDFTKLGAAAVIYLVSLSVLIGTQLVSKKFFSPGQLLLIVVFGCQPLLHQRMLVWWLTLVPWLAAPLWATVAQRLPWSWPASDTPSFRKTIVAGLVVVVLLLWSSPVQSFINGAPAPLERSVSKGTPWQLAEQLNRPGDANAVYLPELADALAAYGPDHCYHGRIFASETLGDYLLWSLPDDMPVYIYTHVHLFSEDHWQKCLIVKLAVAGWENVLAENGINLIVVEAETHPHLRDAVRKDTDWKVVLDETGNTNKADMRMRLFVAVRKKPI